MATVELLLSSDGRPTTATSRPRELFITIDTKHLRGLSPETLEEIIRVMTELGQVATLIQESWPTGEDVNDPLPILCLALA